MSKLSDLNFERLEADLLLDNIEDFLKQEFKEFPSVVEIFKLGRMIGRSDVLRKMQMISDACAEDAKTFTKGMEDYINRMKRQMGDDDELRKS